MTDTKTTVADRLRDAGLKVKPLVWSLVSDRVLDAEGFGVLYRVLERHDGSGALRINASIHQQSEFPTPDTAKAAAQSDYERRILSALEVSDD